MSVEEEDMCIYVRRGKCTVMKTSTNFADISKDAHYVECDGCMEGCLQYESVG